MIANLLDTAYFRNDIRMASNFSKIKISTILEEHYICTRM